MREVIGVAQAYANAPHGTRPLQSMAHAVYFKIEVKRCEAVPVAPAYLEELFPFVGEVERGTFTYITWHSVDPLYKDALALLRQQGIVLLVAVLARAEKCCRRVGRG